MKIITRTPKKAVIQVETEELEKSGFDLVWDEIRSLFPEQNFHLKQLDRDTEQKSFFFELIYKEKNIQLSLK